MSALKQVKTGRRGFDRSPSQCPLYLQKRTLELILKMSALCQKRAFVSAAQIPFGCYDSFVTAIIDADFSLASWVATTLARKEKGPAR